MKREYREAFLRGARALLAEQPRLTALQALEQWQAKQGMRRAVWASLDDEARAELAAAVEDAGRRSG